LYFLNIGVHLTADRTLKQFLLIYFRRVHLQILSRTTLWETLPHSNADDNFEFILCLEQRFKDPVLFSF
jgi:hypothetical protein